MKCEKHPEVEMTGQRGGDPQCVECYVESLEGTSPEGQRHPGRGKIGWKDYHGKVVWVVNGEMLGVSEG
jgi:hypothetical protein